MEKHTESCAVSTVGHGMMVPDKETPAHSGAPDGLFGDPELLSLLNEYSSIEKLRVERAKAALRERIAAAQSDAYESYLPWSSSYTDTVRVQWSVNFALQAFQLTHVNLVQRLMLPYAGDIIHLVPNAKRHVVVLFEASDADSTARVVQHAIGRSLDPSIGGTLEGWRIVRMRAFEAPDDAVAVTRVQDEAMAELSMGFGSMPEYPREISLGVSLAAPTADINPQGSAGDNMEYGWGGAALIALVTPPSPDVRAQAFMAIALPEIVWGVAHPNVLGPLVCVFSDSDRLFESNGQDLNRGDRRRVLGNLHFRLKCFADTPWLITAGVHGVLRAGASSYCFNPILRNRGGAGYTQRIRLIVSDETHAVSHEYREVVDSRGNVSTGGLPGRTFVLENDAAWLQFRQFMLSRMS